MKPQYSILTFLTGLLFVSGVFFVHWYSRSQAEETTEAVASREELTPVTTTSSSVAAPAQTPVPVTKPVSTSRYADGTYTSTVQYETPESTENLSVTLSISNGVVKSASLTNSGAARESFRYQSAFAGAYRPYVVGKPISSLRLSYVSGSSLTTAAFNQALSQIRSQASS